jgi:hypothetical protein
VQALGHQFGYKWFEDFQAEFLVSHGSLINSKFHPKNYIK